MPSSLRHAFVALLLASAPALVASDPLHAQSGGRAVTTLDGVFTEVQAQRGRRTFDASCSLCHGAREFTGRVFQLTWGGQPLSALYTHLRTTMPLDNPGRLTPEQYADVVAYMLSLNDYPRGARELAPDPEALGQIRFERIADPES